MRRTALNAALGLLALTGCASFNEVFSPKNSLTAADCRAADWRLTGETDALRGRPSDRIALYRDACEGYGVIPNPDAYARGHAQGVQLYCTPKNAYVEGRAGRPIRQTACPIPSRERDDAWAHGAKYRKIRKEIAALRDRDAGLGGDAGAAGSKAPLYARPEFNPAPPRRLKALQAELQRYSSWPPGG